MAIITLDDGTARMEAVVYSDVFMRVQRFLQKDKVLIAQGVLAIDDFSGGCAMTVMTSTTWMLRAHALHAALF